MITAQPSERRRHPRVPANCAAKMFFPSSLHFGVGCTTDVSAGGALVRVERSRSLRPGDRVEVAIASGRGASGVVRAEDLWPGEVVRVIPIDCHEQAIAVRFDQPTALPIAA